MRYATGQSLARDLRAGEVPEPAIAEMVECLSHRLWCFSPGIQPCADEPGVFWLDASGMMGLYPSLERWAECVRGDLRDAGFYAVVAVGFSRFGSYAAAKARSGVVLFQDPDEERAHLRGVPVARLGIAPDLRDTLFKLGIESLGQFADLPAAGIRKRFGPDAEELYQLARGEGWAPLTPHPLREPIERTVYLDYPETNTERLLVVIEPLLHGVLDDLRTHHEYLTSLQLAMVLDNRDTQAEELSPATALTSGVVELTLRAEGVSHAPGQLDLFHDKPQRNRDAIHKAFAALRAELGNDAIVHARLREGHLPEARFDWEPLRTLPAPEARLVASLPLVRRIFSPTIGLASPARREPDGWLIARFQDGPIDEILGPYLVSGGWWTREIARAYYYVRTRSGRWLWIYNDQKRRRWFLQGEVE
jgi:protein ImuB